MVQKLWTKTSVFNKNRKLNLYILWRNYKGRLCTEWIFHILHMSFFFTIIVIKSSTQVFAILGDVDMQKIIEGLDINPNSHVLLYILPHIKIKIFIKIAYNFVTSPAATFITMLHKIFHQIF